MPRALIAIALLLAASAARADIDRPFFMRLVASFLKVEVINADGGYSLGTGVTVAKGKVVTNCHVTRNAVRISLVKGGVRLPVTLESADLEHDVCLLEAPTLDAPPVELGSAASVKVGQSVAAVGYTGGLQIQFREGVVRAVHRFDGGRVIQSSTPFTSGASGGGLFDEQGRLVGILTFRLRSARGFYYSAPVEWFAGAIGDNARFVPVTPSQGTAPFWQRPLDRPPFFMQAASLEAEEKWHELIRLTERWTDADGRDAEAWFLRGKAYGWLDRQEAAARSFRRAVDIDPTFSQAWYDLGVASFRLGHRADLESAWAALSRLDEELAGLLAVTGGLPSAAHLDGKP